MFLVAALAAFALAGCAKSASVEGAANAKLTLVKPSAVTVHRGGMAKADIQIKRQDLPGDVTIRFTNLPKGVEIVESDSKIVGDKGSYTLRAGDAADLVENFSADVTATAGPGNISVSEPINISVKEKL
jgi:hypothetical protein